VRYFHSVDIKEEFVLHWAGHYNRLWMQLLFPMNYKITWSAELFIDAWLASRKAACLVLVRFVWIVPTTIWTSFSNIAALCHNTPLQLYFSGSSSYQDEVTKQS